MLAACMQEFEKNPVLSFDSASTSSADVINTEMIRGWKTKVSENLPGVSEQNKFNPFVDRLPPSD